MFHHGNIAWGKTIPAYWKNDALRGLAAPRRRGKDICPKTVRSSIDPTQIPAGLRRRLPAQAVLSACTTMGGPISMIAPTPSDPPLPDPTNRCMRRWRTTASRFRLSLPADRSAVPAPDRARPHRRTAGSLIVDTASHISSISSGRTAIAIRYGVGLGRAGFEWAGAGVIQWKQKWPKWTPPAEMIARDPSLEKWSAEMAASRAA